MSININIAQAEALIKDFESVPKAVHLPTYLELCRYPYRRFEEICSRLLAFFLNPNGEHRFRELFLKSFFGILEPVGRSPYHFDNVIITEEENADGKRIDLIIESEEFIIGIENKISADLYNPLEKYKERLEKETKKHYGVVLSLKKIVAYDQLQKLNENDFINVTYAEYFSALKKNLGFFLDVSHHFYLNVVIDFIKTIENMEQQAIDDVDKFFFNNENEIKELLTSFSNFEQKILNIQAVQIGQLKEFVKKKTNDENWWIYDKWDLGCTFYEGAKRIGIESFYKPLNHNPLGEFIIEINTWDEQDWDYFKPKLVSDLSQGKVRRERGRTFMTVSSLENPEHEKIVEELTRIYIELKKLNLSTSKF